MISNTDILTTLAYLMGERGVVSSTTSARSDFIQETLNDAYAAHPWRFARAVATLSISNGVATLPTNYDVSNPLNASWYSDGVEIPFNEIDSVDSNQAADGTGQFWLTAINGTDGFTFNTKETAPSQVVVTYQQLAPILASTSTAYPSKMTIALGARRYVKLAQNPDADISQDQKLFEKALNSDIAAHQIPAPRKQRRTRQQSTNSFTGDF